MSYFTNQFALRAFIFIGALCISVYSNAQTLTTYILDENTPPNEWTVPNGVSVIRVECIGAGGGGGFVDLVNPIEQGAATGGGGGGAYASSVLCVTPGETFNFNIGLGGSGQDGISNGGTTWFGNSEQDPSVKAEGGFGVENNNPTGGSGGSIQASIGDLLHAGGNGGKGAISGFTPGGGSPLNDVVSGGGGGAAASNLGNGNNGGNGFASWTIDFSTFSAIYEGTPGEGGVGDGYGGNGGTGAIACAKTNQVPTLDAENGSVYGAGGGGGIRAGSDGSNRPMKPGGNGAAGVIIITVIAKDITISAGPDISICEGEEVTIQGEFTYEGDQSPDISFQWDGIGFIQNETTISPTISPTQDYSFIVHPIIEGCELEYIADTVHVTVMPKTNAPQLSFLNSIESNCHGREITINANNGNNQSGINLEWIVSTGNILNFPDQTNEYIATDLPQETTTYSVVVQNNGNCSDTSHIIYELPTITNELAYDNESATCYVSGNKYIHFYNPTTGRYIGSFNPQNQEGVVTMSVHIDNSVNLKEACEHAGDENFWTSYLQRKYTIDLIENQFNSVESEIMLPFLTAEKTSLALAAGDSNTPGTLTPNNPNDNLINGIDDLGITQANGEICNLSSESNWYNQSGNGDTPNNINNAEYIEVNISKFGDLYIHASKNNSQLSVVNEGLNQGSIKTYPNPSDGTFTISIDAAKEQNTILKVYDLGGRIIASKVVSLSIGSNKIPFDISTIESGTYILVQQSENNNSKVKLIIE